jgi:hypothetical protein
MPGGEKRRDGRASHHEACGAMESFLLLCVATGVSLRAVWCLIGATPGGQPWTSAVTLPHRRNGLSARRMAVLDTFRELSLCRQVHHELMRSAALDLAPIIPATACHQRNYVERYSRYKRIRLCFCAYGHRRSVIVLTVACQEPSYISVHRLTPAPRRAQALWGAWRPREGVWGMAPPAGRHGGNQ